MNHLITKNNIMRRFAILFLLLLALVITFSAYYRGLAGTFVLDDGPTIINNANLQIHELTPDALKQAAFSSNSGPLRRPISMASFAINHYVTGLQPYYFKLTNVVIHLINGIGIFVLTTLLLNIYRQRLQPALTVSFAQWLSLAVASAWLLHPFNLTSVLYVTQRMTSLSTFFSIWGLALFLWGRIRLYEGKNGFIPILASLLVFTPLAVFSKESGALLPIFMLIAEITLFNFQAAAPFARRFMAGFYVLAVGVPIAAMLTYIATHSGWLLGGYATRDFTLFERLITEARVLWFYLHQIVLPSTSQMGLFHDDIAISRGLFQPLSTILSLFGILALLVLSFIARKKAPLISFGLLFFFAGHGLESTIFPFEIAHEHRNYLPMFGILLILFFYLLYPLIYVKNLRLRQAGAILLITLFAINTFTRATAWSNQFDFNKAEVEHHPDSAHANSEMGDVYSKLSSQHPNEGESYYFLAFQHYGKSIQLDSNDTHGLFGLIRLSSASGKPVDPHWINELMRRLEQQPTTDYGYKLVSLITCQIDGICKLTREEIEGIVQASLRNPMLRGKNRANVYTAWNLYLGNIANDYSGALDALYQAIKAAPDELDYRLNLVKFLMLKENFVQARSELTKVRRLDNSRIHISEVEFLDNILTSHGK